VTIFSGTIHSHRFVLVFMNMNWLMSPSGNYWLNRKNICEPMMGLVTVF